MSPDAARGASFGNTEINHAEKFCMQYAHRANIWLTDRVRL